MIATVSSMPFKTLQKQVYMCTKPCINMLWDSGNKNYTAYTRPGPIFEPQLPRIDKRFKA